MKTIKLHFDKSLIALAGNPFGRAIFDEQVDRSTVTDDTIVIEFPEQIVKVASSFVQGFFSYWLDSIGIEGIQKQIKIVTSYQELTNYIWDNLL